MAGDLLPAAQANPANQDTLTRLRRGFHTLKGSGRMVGLEQFALAAAAVEKVHEPVAGRSARRHARPAGAAGATPTPSMSAWVAELARAGRSARSGEALAAAAARVQEGEAVRDRRRSRARPAPCEPRRAEPDPSRTEAEAAPLPDNVLAFPLAEENLKRIGGLEIPLPLYNIYLGETEELRARAGARTSPTGAPQPLRAVSGAGAEGGAHAGRHLGHGRLPCAVRDRGRRWRKRCRWWCCCSPTNSMRCWTRPWPACA